MKKYYTLLIAILLTFSANAQAPEQMSYQAVIRDASNALVTSQAIGMQISILKGSAAGAAVYTEAQTANTNTSGLVSLEIGTGTTSDDFSTIDWANDTYFIKIETDPTGGSSYTVTGTSKLMSVPYALHAKTAENVSGLEALDEGNGIGWRLKGQNPDYYGNIGKNAVNFSYSEFGAAATGATGSSSTAMGEYTTASGIASTAMGSSASAFGDNATAMGRYTTAEGNSSVAIGDATTAIGNNSTAMGSFANAEGNNSTAMGDSTHASGESSTAMGIYTTAPSFGETALGTFNTTYTPTSTNNFIDTDRLLVVGNGDPSSAESDALIILKNGTITAPSLDISEITDNKALATKEYVDALKPKVYAIGDVALGGVVIWVDKTGHHGLVCSLNNLGDRVPWMDHDDSNSFNINFTSGNGIGAGKLNTVMILLSNDVQNLSNSNFAALLCATYSKTDINSSPNTYDDGGGTITISYSDWYLPSIYELSLIYPNKELISSVCVANGGDWLEEGEFWSSNQYSDTAAWEYFMYDNTPTYKSKNNKNPDVRAFRSF